MKTKLLLLLVTFAIFLAFIRYIATLNPSELVHHKQIADVVQAFAFSFGAVLTAIGGYRVIGEWLRTREEAYALTRRYKKKYPIDKLGKDDGYSFIVKESSQNHVFLWDKKENNKRHVANLTTLRKVWFPDPPRDVIADEKFSKIDTADSIDISDG